MPGLSRTLPNPENASDRGGILSKEQFVITIDIRQGQRALHKGGKRVKYLFEETYHHANIRGSLHRTG